MAALVRVLSISVDIRGYHEHPASIRHCPRTPQSRDETFLDVPPANESIRALRLADVASSQPCTSLYPIKQVG